MATACRGAIIVVDDAVPHADAALAGLGVVRRVPGRQIDRACVREADVLVTRTITTVDASLVAASRLSLVATATAGVDHVDQAALAARGIAFASAAGCNAQAVAEYVLAALMETRTRNGPVGVVGFGHVGRRTTALLRAFGMTVDVCDPPLERRRASSTPIDRDPVFDAAARTEPLLPLSALLRRCSALSLHVPLIAEGPHPTADLIGPEALSALPDNATVLSTCRGGVVNERALLGWLAAGRGQAVLDVFCREPSLQHPALLDPARGVVLATPHIAGYTHEGKRNATHWTAMSVASHLGQPLRWRPPPTPSRTVPLPESSEHEAAIVALIRREADLQADSDPLRALAALPAHERGPQFDQLRRSYALRSEHRNITVRVDDTAATTANRLRALGFAVAPRGASPTDAPIG